MTSACVTVEPAPPPPPPALEVLADGCHSAADLADPVSLTPEKARNWQDVSNNVGPGSKCLIEGERAVRYIVFKLPENGPNHVLTVGGLQETHRTFAPSVALLNAEGAVVRTFPAEKYMTLGDSFGVQFRPGAEERFMLVMSNPELVGATRAGVEQRMVAGSGYAYNAYGGGSYTTYSGVENRISRTFSHEGVITVRVQATKGNIGQAG